MASDNPFFKYFANLRGKGWLLLLALAGVLLLVFGGADGGTAAKQSETDLLAATEEYRLSLEKELTDLCASVRGVGRVELTLTLDGSAYAVYATDPVSGGEKYVTVGGAPVLLSHEYPAVRGVALVCDGGDDPAAVSELTALLSAALNIGCNRIYISPRA